MKRTALIGVALVTTPAYAQQVVAPPATQVADTPPAVEEITVTAQRRSERLVDVPVSVVVTSGETLDRLKLTAGTDLQYVTPGLTVGDSATLSGVGLAIRSVGTAVFADGIEQSVATVVDGIPYARAGQGFSDLSDVERIEVLKGPQGLLFGRNASAGLVNIISRKPDDRLSARLNFTYGSANEVSTSGSVSGPLGGGFGALLSGYLNRRDGYVTDVATGQHINDRNEYGFRGALRYATADERIEVVLRGDYSKRENICCTWTVRQFASPTSGLSQLVGPIQTGARALQNNATGSFANYARSSGGSAEVNVRLGDYTLTSISGYRNYRQNDNSDVDLSPYNVLDLNSGLTDLNQYSQELRLTSPSEGPIKFVAGLFYYEVNNYTFSSQVGKFSRDLALAGAAGVPVDLGGGIVIPPAALAGRDWTSYNDVRDLAAFGQAELKLTDRLSMVAGGRVTNTRNRERYSRVVTPGIIALNDLFGGSFTPLSYNGALETTNFSWRVGPQFHITHDVNVYASVARGFKGPGFNTNGDISADTILPGQTAAQTFSIRPEIPTAYEVGFKGQFFDRRLVLTAALFRTDFKDFQGQTYVIPPGQQLGNFVVTNAGKLRTQGVEVELSAQPTKALTIGAGLTYTDATFLDFKGASCPALGALVTTVGAPCGPTVAGGDNAPAFDAKGLSLAGAPKLIYNVNLRYEADVGLPVKPFFQTNIYGRSSTTYALYPRNIPNVTVQKAYALVNVDLGVTALGGKVSANVFVRNLFDQNYVTQIFDLPFDDPGGLGQFVTRDAQRTVGLQINLRY